MWGYPQHQVLNEKNQPQSFPSTTNYDIYGSYYEQQKDKRIGLDHTPEVLKNIEIDERKVNYRTTGEEYGAFMNLNSQIRPPRWYVVPDSNKVHPTRIAGQYIPESQVPAGLSTKYGHFDKPPSNMIVHQPSFNSRLEYSSNVSFKPSQNAQSLQSPPPPPPQELMQTVDDSQTQSMYKLIQHQPTMLPSPPPLRESNSFQNFSKYQSEVEPSFPPPPPPNAPHYISGKQTLINSSLLPPPPPRRQPASLQQYSSNQSAVKPSLSYNNSIELHNKVENYEEDCDEPSLPSNLPTLLFANKKICLPDIESVEFHMKDRSKILLSVREFYKGINLL